jgi:hypothetical protein
MDRPPADGDGIVERTRERRLPVPFAARQCGKAGFALPAERRVDAELGKAMAGQLRLHGCRRNLVGVLQFDRGKARGGGSDKTFKQRTLGEQKGEIRG